MNRTLARLNSIHEELLGTVGSLEADVYARQPAAGEWSVAEIVHHVCLVEARVIKELEKAIARPPQRVGFLRRFIPTSIVSVRLVRVKAPKAMNPLDAPLKEAAIANFDRIREGLKALCATHGKERLKNVIFKHPFLGELDGVAAVSFLGYHERRHTKQIREVLQKINSAADARG